MIANWWEETKNMNLLFPSQNVKSWLVSKAQISIIVTCWIFAPKSTRSRAKLMSNDWRKTIVLSTDAFQNHSGGRAQLRQIIKIGKKSWNWLIILMLPISGNGNAGHFLKKTCEITSSELISGWFQPFGTIVLFRIIPAVLVKSTGFFFNSIIDQRLHSCSKGFFQCLSRRIENILKSWFILNINSLKLNLTICSVQM